MPYFIITAGATGSGKTKLIDETLDYLGISNELFERIMIDNLVENNENYKMQIKNIIMEEKSKCVGKSESCNKNAYLQPSKELFDKFRNAYYSVRDSPNCLKNNPMNCNAINDEKIKTATSLSKNIIFESSSNIIPKWLLNINFIPSHYTVILSYSLVNIKNLQERNKLRAYEAIQKFEKNNYSPAPRLPNVSNPTFNNIIKNIKYTLIKIYKKCIKNYSVNIGKCGNKKINQLLLFDNNTVMQKKFDSKIDNTSSFYKTIKKSFGNLYVNHTKRNTKRKTKRKTKKSFIKTI